MGGRGLLLMGSIVLAASVACAEEKLSHTEAAIANELARLETQIGQVQDLLAEIRSKIAGKRLAALRPTRPVRKGPDLDALRKLKLPGDPTEEQVRQYIISIYAASKAQTTFSDDDPQPELLARLGRERLGVLLETWERYNYHTGPLSPRRTISIRDDEVMISRFPLAHPFLSYLESAVVHIATEEDKQLIVEALPGNHSLVRVILKKGWEAAAKDTLTSVLASRPNIVHPGWIEATARLRDPDTYEDLMAYLVKGANPHGTYRSIRSLPGLDVSGAVAEAWEAARSRRDSRAKCWIAVFAVEHGHLDALEYLVGFHEEKLKLAFAWQSKRAGSVIRSRTSFSGPMEQVGNWFRKNKKLLSFDARQKKFVIRGEKVR